MNRTLQEVKICRDYDSSSKETVISYIEYKFSKWNNWSIGTDSGDCATFKSDEGYPIVGFHGTYDSKINTLGVIYQETK
ncbi:MAG: hypothetical protein GY757_27200 [bacterium]|nr:hypothetical protein [bacterium]